MRETYIYYRKKGESHISKSYVRNTIDVTKENGEHDLILEMSRDAIYTDYPDRKLLSEIEIFKTEDKK